jgi:putative phosphoribosyl transferase
MPGIQEQSLHVGLGEAELAGDLTIPPEAKGLVLFAHGSGSSRHSPRNRYVAGELHRAHIGTFLVDLLTANEEQIDLRTMEFRFNIGLLAERVVQLTDWSRKQGNWSSLPLGYFGASTGSAAALVAAAARPHRVQAVVSRGGRPDLAPPLSEVEAPTLLIVGGNDSPVLEWNRRACERLAGITKLAIIPGATHLFEEPGALEEVARLAVQWFARYLSGGQA